MRSDLRASGTKPVPRSTRKEVKQLRYHDDRYRFAVSLRQRELEQARLHRLSRASRRRDARPIRRSIGRSLVRIGSRIAAEPLARLA